MAYLWKKYEFESEEQADSKISALPDNHNVVRLGYLSDKYSVDVLWEGLEESPYGWKSKEITVEGNGVHTFANYEYKN
jgi:hypothetical protein